MTSSANDRVESNPVPADAALRDVCVYCGSSDGGDPAFALEAHALGASLAREGIGLVYGGGGRGLMGTVARAALNGRGKVTGITPDFLFDRESPILDAHEHVVVPDMHDRKRLMYERADAFVALPGGVGTLEEVVEQLTWVQLARHAKPVLFVDVQGFWQPLLGLLDHMRGHGFIDANSDVRCLVAKRASDVVPMLREAIQRRGLVRDAAPAGL